MSNNTTLYRTSNHDYPAEPGISIADGKGNVAVVADGGVAIEFTDVELEPTGANDGNLFDELGFTHASKAMVPLTSNYLVKGLLSAGALSTLYGPSNSGKTFVALDLAYRIASGMRWNGHRVRQALVLYVATEGGTAVNNRIVALRERHEEPGSPGQAHFYHKVACIDLLADGAPDAGKIVRTAKFYQRQTGAEHTMIVIDTLSRAMAGGDENGSSDMTAAIKAVDMIRQETGAHVMLVHHTGKEVARGARGHSSLRAAVDTEIEIVAEENKPREIVVRKQRDYETGKKYPFDLEQVLLGIDDEGDEITTCIAVTPRQADPLAGACPEDERECLETIGRGFENGEKYTDSARATSRWAGNVIMRQMNKTKDEASGILEQWIARGSLIRGEYHSKRSGRVEQCLSYSVLGSHAPNA